MPGPDGPDSGGDEEQPRHERLLEAPPHALAERIVAEATELAGGPVGLYVIDLEGVKLRKVAGAGELPPQLESGRHLGAEVAIDMAADLRRIVAAQLPAGVCEPLWVGGRAFAVLVSGEAPRRSLERLARDAAPAVEIANHHTDVFHTARRANRTTPGAELQQDLLPPPIGRVEGAELAASVVPAYAVGGDWFDWAQNAGEVRLSVADVVGKGSQAMAVGALALGALRAARRSGDEMEDVARAVHHALEDIQRESAWVTAILARWEPASSTLAWVNCGHPPPLVLHRSGELEALEGGTNLPLGLSEGGRTFEPGERRLEPGQRVIFYSDGVTERRSRDGGFFGREGIRAAAAGTAGQSAAATVGSILAAVADASDEPVQDDATVLVLATGRGS